MPQCTLDEFHEFLGCPMSDISALEKALIAPGAEGDKNGSFEEKIKYEGNRTLAHIGDPLHQLAVKKMVLEGIPRGITNDLLISSFAQLEQRARLIGLYGLIRLNPRQNGFVGRSTLRLVFSAIIGAVYENCERNEKIATEAAKRLYFGPLLELVPSQTISLPQLEIQHVFNRWDSVVDTPIARLGSPSTLMLSTKILRNTWPLIDDSSPLVISGASQLWECLELPLQEQNRILPCPSSQMSELVGEFPESSVNAEQITLQSSEMTSTCDNTLPQNTPNTHSHSHPSHAGQNIVFETIEFTATIPPLVTTTSSDPTRNEKIRRLHAHRQADACVISPPSRKRRSHGQDMGHTQLEEYIRLEKKRCLSTGLDFFDSDLALAVTSSTLTLYFGISSPEVIALLQDLVKVRRERFAIQNTRERRSLSPAERILAIEGEDAKMAYTCFRKRCHVHQLFVDCRSEGVATAETFITSTTLTMTKMRAPQIGNPQNLELASISDKIFKLAYPGLEPEDPSYDRKRKYANQLRKLGQRLHLLVDKFGYGILGLIPLPSNEPSLVQALNITDGAILRIPDERFRHLVNDLEQRLGSILREMSHAVKPVVEAIFNEEMDFQGCFSIEKCEQAHIVQFPRGCRGLLNLIS